MKSGKHFQWLIFALGVLMLLAMVVSVRADDDDLILDDEDSDLILEDDDDLIIDDDDDDKGGCPSPRKGLASGKSEITKTFDCPADDGKIYATSSGEYMYIQCCTDRTFGRNIGGGSGLTFGQCMDLCMKEESGDCRSVTWDAAGGSRADGINCAMWAHGGFSTVESKTGGHHAFLVEAPYEDQPDDEIELCSTQCPGANNQVFKTEYGETFLMVCGKRHGTPGQSQYVDSYEQCMTGCGMLVQCRSVDYHHRTGRCTFSDHGGEPMIDAPGYASAYSMGCSGACKEYPKPPPPAQENHCPAPGKYHGAYWAIDNKPWETRCSSWNHKGTSYVLDDGPVSLEDCMKQCQDDSKCIWGSFVFDSGKCLGITKTWTTNSGIDGSYKDWVNFQPVTPPSVV